MAGPDPPKSGVPLVRQTPRLHLRQEQLIARTQRLVSDNSPLIHLLKLLTGQTGSFAHAAVDVALRLARRVPDLSQAGVRSWERGRALLDGSMFHTFSLVGAIILFVAGLKAIWAACRVLLFMGVFAYLIAKAVISWLH